MLGIGHLTRSLNIVQQLLKSYEVTFIQGGNDVGLTLNHPNFKKVLLTPMQMKPYTQEYFSLSGESITEIWKKRGEELSIISKEKYDFLITELFPFGRRKFKREITKLIKDLKVSNPSLKAFSSIRDILVDEPDESVIEDFKSYYDKVFIHSPPQDNLLFTKHKFLNGKVVYTGYVSSEKSYIADRREDIIVSIGGGAVGEELIRALLQASQKLRKYNFLFVLGFNSSEHLNADVFDYSQMNDNVEYLKSVSDIEPLMAKFRLSISMGGYNTIMNLLTTRTYGLCYAYDENDEQRTRIEYFENSRLLKLITKDDFNNLESIIEDAMKFSSGSVSHEIETFGASELESYLSRNY